MYSFEELLEEDYGKVGTPERDAFERSVDEAVQAYRVGEAIKQARESQNLTQAELGEKMGVQRAQVCRLESGKSITLTHLPSYPVMTGRFSVSQMSRMKFASILPWRGKARR